MRIQLDGNILLGTAANLAGTDDYSDQVASLVINRKRPGVSKPATYGTPESTSKPGADTYEVSIVFHTDEGDASNIWSLFWSQMNTADGEVFFSATYGPGAVSATNPRFQGWIQIVDLDAGTPVTEFKSQTKTFPARLVTGPLNAALA